MKRLAAVMAVLLIAALGGCMRMSADDLYQLPQLSEEYLRLQSAIDAVLDAGAEYAAPSSGANRQPIQREDLDGDGIREVLAFFNVAGSDRPLKALIFRAENDGYREVARLEGEGSGIDSVAYLDMDGDGIREVAIGWQIGAGINMLSVYSVKGWKLNQLMSTNYSEFTVCSLDDDPGEEILALRLSQSDTTGEAEHYTLTADGEIVSSTARLSSGVGALSRVRGTQLLDGREGVLVESTISGDSFVTDIFAYNEGRFANITIDEMSGSSYSRSYSVYCRDVNNDGVLEVPRPVPLPATSENTTYYMIEWYSYYSNGGKRLVTTTFNNFADSWYLTLEREWIGHVAVSREEAAGGERMIIFSTLNDEGGRGTDFVEIYTLTGENRAERAVADGRFILYEEGETVYAAKILAYQEETGLPVSPQQLRTDFGMTYSEWVTGET